jgi:hypothetical protein
MPCSPGALLIRSPFRNIFPLPPTSKPCLQSSELKSPGFVGSIVEALVVLAEFLGSVADSRHSLLELWPRGLRSC